MIQTLKMCIVESSTDIRMDTIPEQISFELDTNIDRTTNGVQQC